MNENQNDSDRFATSRNFLATDKVPDTIFGIPVVSRREDYSGKDLEFFRKHPEAGGYYDLGDDEPVEDGSEEGAPVQDDEAGDVMTDQPTLSDDRPMHFFRDKNGKIEGYGTTRSIVHEADGRFFVIPTILDDGAGGTRVVGDADAAGWFSETGEHWGGYGTRRAAEAAAKAVHERHQRKYGRAWNEYIRNHWDEMADSIKSEVGPAASKRGKYPGSWNNPGNVQMGEVEYNGEVGSVKSDISEGTFLKFKTPQDGLNAKAQAIGQIAREKIPKRYSEGKLPSADFTVSNLIKVYAPPEDGNDTEGYIKFVAGRTGVGRDQVLDQRDVKTMSLLLDAIIRRDSGHPYADWFTDDERKAAVGKMGTPARRRAGPKRR